MRNLTVWLCWTAAMSVANLAWADIVIHVQDAQIRADPRHPSVVTLPIELRVTDGADANLGDTVLSWDIESINVANLTGNIAEVTVDRIVEGDLFQDFPSFYAEPGGFGSPLAATITTGKSPYPALADRQTLALVHLRVPAGQTGSFDLVLDGVDGKGEFAVFGDAPEAYSQVSVQNATISVVPEPSAWALLSMVTLAACLRRSTSRFAILMLP